MTLIKESSDEGHEEYIFPCDCHDWHYLRMAWDSDPRWRTLWIEDAYRPRLWRDKLKAIWSILRSRPVCYSEIILNPKTVNSLREVLSEE